MSDEPKRTIARIPDLAAAGTSIQRTQTIRELTVDYFLMTFVNAGSRVVTNGSMTCECSEGQAMIMTPGRYDVINIAPEHGYYESDWLAWDSRLVKVVCTADYQQVLRGARRIAPFPMRLADGFSNARDAVKAYPKIPEQIVSIRIDEIILWLEHQGIRLANLSTQPLSQKIRTLVSNSPSQKWTTADLASHFAMSESTLRRKLASENVSASGLVSDVRMWHAMAMLQSTNLPVSRIALDCGYESASRFAARFRNRFGFPPTHLRGHNREI